ncbi:hypothetical protein [Marinobacter sp.]
MKVLAETKPSINVVAVIAAAENMPTAPQHARATSSPPEQPDR